MADPFADMAPPSYSGCDDNAISLKNSQKKTLTPSGSTPYVICGDLSLGAQSSMTLNPGVYVVTGSLSMGGQTSISGTGVTIYLPNGGVDMAGGASVDLHAPTSGDWQGILFYEARLNTTASSLVGGTSQNLDGALYFPSAALTYTGGSALVASHTTIVSDTLSLVGNSNIATAASTAFTGVTGGVSVIE